MHKRRIISKLTSAAVWEDLRTGIWESFNRKLRDHCAYGVVDSVFNQVRVQHPYYRSTIVVYLQAVANEHFSPSIHVGYVKK